MNLEEAREIAKNYQKPTFYDHEIVLILDDRITELEAQRDELLSMCNQDTGYLPPTLRVAKHVLKMLADSKASDKEDK